MEGNIAKVIDLNAITPEQIPAIEKCPTNAIGRIVKPKEGDLELEDLQSVSTPAEDPEKKKDSNEG